MTVQLLSVSFSYQICHFPTPHIPVRADIMIEAGLLAFPILLYLPGRGQWRYTNRIVKGGLQLQEQLRILTGFPFIGTDSGTDCLVSVAKIQLFSDLMPISRFFFFL